MTIVDTPNGIGFRNLTSGTKREREVQEELVAPKKQCLGPQKRQFHASVSVAFDHDKNEVVESFSTYPLRIIQQDTWLPHASLSILGFGGGIINEERVALNLNITEGATASVKTIGPKKIYRATDGRRTSQEFHNVVEKNALLVFSPEPISCAEDSAYHATHEFIVQEDASLVFVDWFTSGRQNKNEFWQYHSFENHLRIFSDDSSDHCLFYEDQIIQNNTENCVNIFNQSVKEFNQVQLCGTVLLLGPRTEEIRSSLKDLQTRQSFLQKQLPLHVTTIRDDLMVVKFTSPSQQSGYELLVELLRPLRNELNGHIPYEEHIHYEQNSSSLNDKDSSFSFSSSSSAANNTFSMIQDNRNVVIV